MFSERFECRPCGIAYEAPQPRLFSFNNPFGACPTCHGFGNIIELDMNLVVPDQTKTINQGAIEPWSKPHYRAQLAELKRAARRAAVRLDVPWADLTDDERRFVIDGDPAPGSGSPGPSGANGGAQNTGNGRAASKESTAASAVSFAGWSERNTRCTYVSFSAVIEAICRVPIVAVRDFAARRATCVWQGRQSMRYRR